MLVREYGRVDIPDIPLGKPSTFSPVLAVYASNRLGAEVIAHLRVIDHNILSLKSIIKTLSYVGVRKLILLRGDPPQQGGPCKASWSPEEAVNYAEKYGVEAGLLLSPRKPLSMILQRLFIQARYYYITRVSPTLLGRIEEIVRARNRVAPDSGLGAYIVLRTARNTAYLEEHGIPSVSPGNVPRLMERLYAMGFQRIILSAPGDGWYLLNPQTVSLAKWAGSIGRHRQGEDGDKEKDMEAPS